MAAPRTATTGHRQTHRTIAGVRVEFTGLGARAQGLSLEQVEDSDTYWTTRLPSGETVDGRTLDRLVHHLVNRGHLTKDVER
jgi:hypothetical protein